jgi:hypothetical protein
MADELSRVGTRAAAREAKRQLWRLVDYYRALEACCASWIAQTRIDACKLLHVPARVVLSDRTRKDQVESRLHRLTRACSIAVLIRSCSIAVLIRSCSIAVLTYSCSIAVLTRSCSIAVLIRAWDTRGQVRVVFVPAERLAAAVLEAAPVVRFDA